MYIDKIYPFEKIKLDYDFSTMEECLGYESLSLHYNVIYERYINNLNNILKDNPMYQNYSLDELLFNQKSLPVSIKDDITFNAGGAYNHQVFFASINQNCFNLKNCPIKVAIDKSFGSITNFYQQFLSMAKSLIGSGYVFLVCNEQGLLSIVTTANQETTIPYNLYPLLGIDMWEHSYYLKFKTNKEKYINSFLNMINWPYINQEYIACQHLTLK